MLNPAYNKTAKTTGLPVDEAARKNGARLSAKPREAAQSVSNTMALAVDIYFLEFVKDFMSWPQ